VASLAIRAAGAALAAGWRGIVRWNESGSVNTHVAAFRAAFPDLEFIPEAFVIQGDTVAFRLLGRATHHGSFQGIAPTRRPVTIVSIDIVRFEGDKMAEHWGARDDWALLKQIGARLADG
jgi:predicted ester cyclase